MQFTQTQVTHTFVCLFSSWTLVVEALDKEVQRSQALLQVWEVYALLASSFSERLHTHQTEVTSVLSEAPGPSNTVEQMTVKIQAVQVNTTQRRKNIQREFTHSVKSQGFL